MSDVPSGLKTLEPHGPETDPHHSKRRARAMFEPAIVRRAILDSFVKLDPRLQAKNPVMFIVEVGSVLTTFLFFRDLGRVERGDELVRRTRRGVPVVHGAVRQLRGGDGRRPGQGAGRDAAQDARRDRRVRAAARRQRRRDAVEQAAGRRPLRRAARPDHPRRRRRRRGHRVGRRVGDHRRVGAGHPRVGR